ncbi:MAG: shikimate dehydrogenase [Chloroflexota bacterium]|jgi:shikimate dehydrogenase|nr:shikimate dehydrogenase [Chloroflexota bacterium]
MPRLAYVIGHPIRHSLSPVMHNAAFAACAIDGEYRAIDLMPEQVADWLTELRGSNAYGCNVTVPHKEMVARLVDDVAGDAVLAGAVNTVCRHPTDSRRLVGINTDTIGFRRSLAEEGGISCQGQHVVLLGAGGAARALAVVALQDGAAELVVVNRTEARAEVLLASLNALVGPCRTRAVALGDPTLEAELASATLVVNATSVGLGSTELPADPASVSTGCMVMDIIYNPRATAFLIAAARAGAHTVGGLGMLVHQAGAAFEQWTGVRPPVEVMRAAAEQALSIPA